ncbi:amidase [Candidatus Palauibacter sp.]|uniref:amidase n=1 Tax=Candidatus Palauibacter sp. TaxID=3101350 RepID=UPI003B024EC1
MTDFRDPALLSAREQARRIRAGELTAAELFGACLARVERHNPELNAVVTLNPAAEAEAAAVDAALAAGGDPGPLAGLVVGVKDVTETAGLRTTYGSPLFADHVPERDAVVVRRLREAGAVILGKTNTPEFAAGGNTWNEVFGLTRNPWNPALSAGGSTGGGAVALATGMVSLAQGTDLGGSLRIPASFCGVTGLRPTPGLVPTVPAAYLWDDLQATGLMGREPGDISLGLRAISGPDPASPVCAPEPRWDDAEVDLGAGRWAYAGDIAGIGIDAAVDAACREALAALRAAGARVEEIDLSLSYGRDAFLALRGHWFVSYFERDLDRVDAFGPNVSANLRSGLALTPAELGAAENVRRRVREAFCALFERYDALLTPCMAIPPFPVEQNYPETVAGRPMKTYVDWIAPTFLLSLPGLPVACVPAGRDANGLPAGLQVVAPPRGEARALAVASAIASTRPIGFPPLVTDRSTRSRGNVSANRARDPGSALDAASPR